MLFDSLWGTLDLAFRTRKPFPYTLGRQQLKSLSAELTPFWVTFLISYHFLHIPHFSLCTPALARIFLQASPSLSSPWLLYVPDACLECCLPPAQACLQPTLVDKYANRLQIARLGLWGRLVSNSVFLLERLIYLTKIEPTVMQKIKCCSWQSCLQLQIPRKADWAPGRRPPASGACILHA